MDRLAQAAVILAFVFLSVAGATWLATRRHLLRALGLVAGLVAGLLTGTGLALAEQRQRPDAPSQGPSTSRFQKLSVTQEWQALVRLWASLNHFEDAPVSRRDYQANREKLDRLKAAVDGSVAGLAKLRGQKLVTANEEAGLSNVLNDRVSHLRRTYSGRTCYRMTQAGYSRQRARRDLEKQLDVLEDLHRRGTVSGKVYEKARTTVSQSLKRLSVQSRPETLDLISRLTRDAARQGTP